MNKSPVAYRASSLARKLLSFGIKAEIFQAVFAAGVVAGMVVEAVLLTSSRVLAFVLSVT